ncbi:MAG: hypothetical protein HQM14_19395 [SAR324 cluster bacterium]|nr:hypothetical protein [SAR324 cluster bacterium]
MRKDLHEMKEDFNNQGIFFSFSGPISQELTVEIGEILKKKMSLIETGSSTILKVFSVVVEQAQNIIHYSDEKIPLEEMNSESDELRFGIILVGFKNDHYFVECGNEIENHKIENLQKKLMNLQNMNKDELKKHYKEQRRKDPDEGSKGAGLGFIEMARKSSEPFEFGFKKISEDVSFFSLKIVI